jgi:hypothetical protein
VFWGTPEEFLGFTQWQLPYMALQEIPGFPDGGCA